MPLSQHLPLGWNHTTGMSSVWTHGSAPPWGLSKARNCLIQNHGPSCVRARIVTAIGGTQNPATLASVEHAVGGLPSCTALGGLLTLQLHLIALYLALPRPAFLPPTKGCLWGTPTERFAQSTLRDPKEDTSHYT